MTNQNAILIYPELSYSILGAAFKVYNQFGWGHKESTYQKAFALTLDSVGLKFEREKYIALKFDNKNIGREFLDFVIENKIVVELKVTPKLGYVHINQVVSYLKNANLPLAILLYFTKDGIKFRRIVNLPKN